MPGSLKWMGAFWLSVAGGFGLGTGMRGCCCHFMHFVTAWNCRMPSHDVTPCTCKIAATVYSFYSVEPLAGLLIAPTQVKKMELNT